VKATESIPKIKVIKSVGKRSGKKLYVVISNYMNKNGDTVIMQLPSSWYKNETEVFKN
jgi:hypothetical protein